MAERSLDVTMDTVESDHNSLVTQHKDNILKHRINRYARVGKVSGPALLLLQNKQ